MVLPEIGGNLVSYEDRVHGLKFLRTPVDVAAIRSNPVEYGIPVLFPPNRYEDGTFTLAGRTYQFPITEPATHNHIHGFFTEIPWEVTDIGGAESPVARCEAPGNEAHVELTQRVGRGHPVFQWFPHTFTIRLRYTLRSQGLEQRVTVENQGQDAMPLMLGFHTTFNVPFAPDSVPEDYRLQVAVGHRWELSERMLPTGRKCALDAVERQLCGPGIDPFYTALDRHYTVAQPTDIEASESTFDSMARAPSHGAALTDQRLGIRLVYQVGPQFRHWMIFNNFGRGGFVCPEPQTGMVNAPNVESALGMSRDETGLVVLEPHRVWTAVSRLHVESIREFVG
ncbi:MAG: aldose 1-epimerase [Alicyclobacillus sp.]|nr:aldose 1-epimerase [Alicyclobacillus sp.]